MSQNDTENIDSTNDEVEETQNQGLEGDDASADDALEEGDDRSSDTDDEGTDDPNELKEKLRTAEDKNKKLFDRTQKDKAKKEKLYKEAGYEKVDGKWVKKSPDGNNNNNQKSDLSMDDFYALQEAKVPKADVDMVKKYAKANDMTIEEALKEDIVKTALETNAAERRTSNATNTDRTRRSSSKPSGDQLLNKFAKTGEVPDDDDQLDDMLDSRYAPKKK